MNASCPWCSAPRDTGPACPRCGADYAKAEAIRKFGRASAAPAAATVAGTPEPSIAAPSITAVIEEPPDVEDPVLEFRFCIVAIPVMLLLGIAFNAFQMGHFLQRTFLSMPIHELGHAVASWFTGHVAIPTLWKTLTFDRGILMPLVMFAGAGALLYRGWSTGERAFLVAGGAIALLQAWGTLISDDTADMLIVFGGDAGGMILGTLLMATFFFGKKTQLYKGSLRWGFIAIGAAAYVDMTAVWLSARRDRTNIPFGDIEGVGHSDALRLSTQWGWSDSALVNRHLGVALACFIALAAVYAWGVHRAWKATLPDEDN